MKVNQEENYNERKIFNGPIKRRIWKYFRHSNRYYKETNRPKVFWVSFAIKFGIAFIASVITMVPLVASGAAVTFGAIAIAWVLAVAPLFGTAAVAGAWYLGGKEILAGLFASSTEDIPWYEQFAVWVLSGFQSAEERRDGFEEGIEIFEEIMDSIIIFGILGLFINRLIPNIVAAYYDGSLKEDLLGSDSSKPERSYST